MASHSSSFFVTGITCKPEVRSEISHRPTADRMSADTCDFVEASLPLFHPRCRERFGEAEVIRSGAELLKEERVRSATSGKNQEEIRQPRPAADALASGQILNDCLPGKYRRPVAVKWPEHLSPGSTRKANSSRIRGTPGEMQRVPRVKNC